MSNDENKYGPKTNKTKIFFGSFTLLISNNEEANKNVPNMNINSSLKDISIKYLKRK